MMRYFIASILLLATGVSGASGYHDMPSCVPEIAKYYDVPVSLIGGIRHAEGGAVGQRVGPNRNGSYDLGPMQINTNWFNGTFNIDLRKYDIHEEDVLYNECTNIAVGTWVLSSNYRVLGDWYQAVAAYNAGIKNRRIAFPYADRVFRWKKRVEKTWVPLRKPTVITADGF